MVAFLVSVIEVNVSLFTGTPKANSISEEQVPMDSMLKTRDHIPQQGYYQVAKCKHL